jgi:ribosomal protein S18 acetylase RimI-like enzyme
MAVTLRPAEPRDAEFLGWASVAAARSQLERGWFDIVLRRDEGFLVEFAKCLALAAARSWWHWSIFRVAEVDGVVAAAMCGFGDASYYRASAAAMAEASDRMGIDEREQAQLWPRGAFIVSASTSEPGAWTIENVATARDYRRRGLVQALIGNELRVAREAGFERAQISVFIGNTSAEHAYEKAGFKFAEEKRAADFEAALGIPGTRRLVRDTAQGT